MKLLLLTSEPVSAAELRSALSAADGRSLDDAEVKVVAPALHTSALRFWMSDADEAIGRAEQVRDETLAELDRADVEATGDTGESDVGQAIEDALVDFPADRIVVFTRPGQRHGDELDQTELRERFGMPVEVVQRD